MADLQYAALALAPALAAGLYWLIYQWRFKKFAHIPSTLSSNFFIGHLGHVGAEIAKEENSDVHPDYAMERLWRQNGCPEFMFIDTRPMQHPLIYVASHELAEQVTKASKTRQYSVTKSPTIQEGLSHLIGKLSLLSDDGESWKSIRKRFNPGFAPQHILSLLPVIIDKTYKFMEKLDELAKSGITTEMESFCTNVTFDIIGEVVTNIDCKAQDGDASDDIVNSFKLLTETYIGDNGLSFTSWNIPKRYRRYRYASRMDAAVKKCITDKWNVMQASGTKETKDRSVLALSLKDLDKLTPVILQSIADQVKTFLFAGHDTTSILLQRLFYALSINPDCLAKIRAEHDAIFGDNDPREVFLARPDETIKALVYTSACIKEALRLWPPAGTARMSHNGFKIRTSSGDEVCLDDCVLYLCQHIIQRDRKVYGDTADDFVPDRWVGDTDTSMATGDTDASESGASNIPISAWRPFERGPRNCIGQELANLEARVILACVMRRYDFVKVGLGEVETDEKGQPMLDEKRRYRTKGEVLSSMAITSKPIDRMVMRVEMHQPSS